MESQSQQWSKSCAGNRPIPWIGVFQYCRMARATLSLSKETWGPVFLFTILFTVFTASYAQPLDWGYATEDNLCLTDHVWRSSWNMLEVKGGPPSVLSSSGVPYVSIGVNRWTSTWMWQHNLVLCGTRWANLLVYLYRYAMWPTWNMSITICWNGHSGAGVMMMGSRGWLGNSLKNCGWMHS